MRMSQLCSTAFTFSSSFVVLFLNQTLLLSGFFFFFFLHELKNLIPDLGKVGTEHGKVKTQLFSVFLISWLLWVVMQSVFSVTLIWGYKAKIRELRCLLGTVDFNA